MPASWRYPIEFSPQPGGACLDRFLHRVCRRRIHSLNTASSSRVVNNRSTGNAKATGSLPYPQARNRHRMDWPVDIWLRIWGRIFIAMRGAPCRWAPLPATKNHPQHAERIPKREHRGLSRLPVHSILKGKRAGEDTNVLGPEEDRDCQGDADCRRNFGLSARKGDHHYARGTGGKVRGGGTRSVN